MASIDEGPVGGATLFAARGFHLLLAQDLAQLTRWFRDQHRGESRCHSRCPNFPIPMMRSRPTRETLEYHHDKHHLAYVNNGNNLAKCTEWENEPLEEVVKGTFGKNQGLFNNAGQHYNHIHFWKWMKPAVAATGSPASSKK
jgi:hypothetical protein